MEDVEGYWYAGDHIALFDILTHDFQSAHPEIVEAIKQRLTFLRRNGATVNLITARAIIAATIIQMDPSIFDKKFRDGSTFRVSDSFVHKFLHAQLSWSLRKATQAAQKCPKDWEDQCERSFFRKAYKIKEEDIPAVLYVNSDQTQIIYAPGNRMTWTETGSKQVAVIGVDEKRAFTLMVSVAADGTVLPFQAIYQNKTKLSLPAATSPSYDDVIKAGFKFEFSGTKTYWSNQDTMRSFVNDILAPYFEQRKVELSLPPSQRSLWQIDVWSVHRSEEFRGWMRENHPNILLDYVPGGCTGVHQPCDVGIQRPLKLSIRKSYHEDIVNEFLLALNAGDSTPILKDTLRVLHDHSVRWMWNAYQVLQNKGLVKKVYRCPISLCLTYENVPGI
jgi:hypothetical protein